MPPRFCDVLLVAHPHRLILATPSTSAELGRQPCFATTERQPLGACSLACCWLCPCCALPPDGTSASLRVSSPSRYATSGGPLPEPCARARASALQQSEVLRKGKLRYEISNSNNNKPPLHHGLSTMPIPV
ncbi:hypothetical protein KC345_g295 [Hortaea werneckii]|nr:hypothetical protein KC345_g295 [Hortaea werneckii]